ncbi:MAG: GHKL domain-containing protein [Alphaproteobacteria bacterium]|nr:MAG: GHKL domain-containing protein [Alphaproteobacteria bacterium]
MNSESGLPLLDPTSFLAALPVPAILLDSQRVIRVYNDPAEATFRNVRAGYDLSATLRRPRLLEAVDRALETGKTESCRFEWGGDPAKTFEADASRISTPESAFVLVIFLDITQALKVEAVRSAFVANVSHELRSPLTTMMGAAEALEGPARDDPVGRDRMLALMSQEAWRMKNLIDDLLSLSRVESQEFIPPNQSVALKPVLESARERLAERAAKRDMDIKVTIETGLPPVSGVDDELFQVFDNLISNAIKYGSAGSTVTVEARQSGSLALVSVHNEGPAIPALHLPRLTERFYRVDKSRSRELGGTGLGLAIVKHIVNRHRGRLEVASSEKDGTTFSVFLNFAGTG